MLGKLPVPGRPTIWIIVGQGPTALVIYPFLSPSLWETARYRLKYCLKGPLNPKQPTNQIHQQANSSFNTMLPVPKKWGQYIGVLLYPSSFCSTWSVIYSQLLKPSHIIPHVKFHRKSEIYHLNKQDINVSSLLKILDLKTS